MRQLPLALLALTVAFVACSSKPAIAVRPTTGCNGPNGSCARYVQDVDGDGAPVAHSRLIVPFTAEVKVPQKPWDMAGVTAIFNFETRDTDYKLIPVTSVQVDKQNKHQVTLAFDGLLSDGSAIDLPDGLILGPDGKSAGPFTITFNTPFSPYAIALAGVQWEATDPSMFDVEHTETPHGAKDEVSVRAELEGRLRLRPGMTDDRVAAILAKYDGDALKKKIPDNRIRAGLLMLTGTTGEPAIAYLSSDTNSRGVPFQPVLVDNLLQYGAFGLVSYNHFTGILQMVIDEQVAADSLENIAMLVMHETMHSSLGGGSATEETLAKAAEARAYEEFLLWDPSLATKGTAFSRNKNIEELALRNSGRFNFPYAGILPRLGVDDILRGSALPQKEAHTSFKELLFSPDFYGEIRSTGDVGNEVLEAYYQRMSGNNEKQGRLNFDQGTLKLFDIAMDHGLTDEQLMAINDALKLKPVPRGGQ